MRIRQVKPAFWHDSLLSKLPEATRLFYIGLWMVADDGGWFRWDPPEIANDLFGYESPARRERRVVTMMGRLVEAGRVTLHPCGHGQIPRLTDHQHLSGLTKQVRTVENQHIRQCSKAIPAGPRESPQTPAEPRPGNGYLLGSVGLGDGSGFAQPREKTVMSVDEVEEERRRLDAVTH